MKIIAVNISVNIQNGYGIKDSVKRAWKLKKKKTENYNYVIGVISGSIKGYFKREDTIIDARHPDRIAFELKEISANEKKAIRNYIAKNNIGLRYFVTKYID